MNSDTFVREYVFTQSSCADKLFQPELFAIPDIFQRFINSAFLFGFCLNHSTYPFFLTNSSGAECKLSTCHFV